MVPKIFNQVSAINMCYHNNETATEKHSENRSFANSCSTVVIMKVQKIPVEEIIVSELTLQQSTTLLKSELLQRYFSKFLTISKKQ